MLPMMPVNKGSHIIGWLGLWVAYMVEAWPFVAMQLVASGVLALGAWGLVQRFWRSQLPCVSLGAAFGRW